MIQPEKPLALVLLLLQSACFEDAAATLSETGGGSAGTTGGATTDGTRPGVSTGPTNTSTSTSGSPIDGTDTGATSAVIGATTGAGDSESTTGAGSTTDESETGGETDGETDGGDPLDDANFIFVTANVYSPDFADDGSEFAGADAACQAEADGAGLGGTYVALLTSDDQHPIARLAGARGWKNTRGFLVADEADDLILPLHVWAVDVNGDFLQNTLSSRTWNGVEGDCGDWTSTDSADVGGAGFPLQRGHLFGAQRACDNQLSLVCAGNDASVAQPVPQAAGGTRVLFLSDSGLPGDSGLGAFDAQCQSEWDAAHPASDRLFTALLASDGASASSRIDPTDATWVLQSGAVVSDSTAGLFSTEIETWPLVRADGDGSLPPSAVWTGALVDPNTAGNADTTCQNWTSTAGNGRAGAPGRFSATWTRNNRSCELILRFYCAENLE